MILANTGWPGLLAIKSLLTPSGDARGNHAENSSNGSSGRRQLISRSM